MTDNIDDRSHNIVAAPYTGAAPQGLISPLTIDSSVCDHRRLGCQEQSQAGTSCDACVVCSLCGNTVAWTQTVQTVRGSVICASCRERSYRLCDTCSGWNRHGSDCENCTEDRDADDEASLLVYNYSYKPVPIFHGTGPLFVGGEIEISTPYGRERECAKLARSCLGRLGYLKADSSIGNGFEIVTHPMAYDWTMANFPWQMLTRLREIGCAATETTGIHVHVSRAGFTSPCHAYRWMKFIYRNEAQVKTLARRSSNHWAAFTTSDRRAVKHYAKGAVGERYRAINTNNADTFELRVFASSLDPSEVQAAFGFAAASVEYTRQLSAHTISQRGGWTWTAFVAWLSPQPAYRPLTQQLEDLACVC